MGVGGAGECYQLVDFTVCCTFELKRGFRNDHGFQAVYGILQIAVKGVVGCAIFVHGSSAFIQMPFQAID